MTKGAVHADPYTTTKHDTIIPHCNEQKTASTTVSRSTKKVIKELIAIDKT